jgi:hypothetical protein
MSMIRLETSTASGLVIEKFANETTVISTLENADKTSETLFERT